MILFNSLFDIYLEINIALIGSWGLFWMMKKIVLRWKVPPSQKNILSFARAAFLVACLSPIFAGFLNLISPFDFQSTQWGADLQLSTQRSISEVQTVIQTTLGEVQATIENENNKIVPQPTILASLESKEIHWMHWFWWFIGMC